MAGQATTYTDVITELVQVFGLSRPAGLCLAAIWRSAQAPCADDLVAGLGIARSNVSTALKELRGWGLAGVARVPGDRREYFTAPSEPWELVRLLISGHERRFLAPALERLVAAEAETGDVRLAALHDTLAVIGGTLATLGRMAPAELPKALGRLEPDDTKPKKKKKKRQA